MTFARQMVEAAEELEKAGHTVVLPRHTKEYAEMKLTQERNEGPRRNLSEIESGPLVREKRLELQRSLRRPVPLPDTRGQVAKVVKQFAIKLLRFEYMM